MSDKVHGGRSRLAIIAVAGCTATSVVLGFAGPPAYAHPEPVPAGSAARAVPPPHPADRPTGSAAAAHAATLRADADRVRARAARQPLPASPVGSYRVSPAVLGLLRDGLDLPVSSALLTGLTPEGGGHLRMRTSAGPTLKLPAAVTAPAFTGTTLEVDPAAGTLTLTATGGGADLNVRVAHATTATLADGAGLTSRLTMRVPAMGTTVALAGELRPSSGAVGVSLSGHLDSPVVLRKGVAGLARGTTITLNDDGLRLAGTAELGPVGHVLPVSVSGPVPGRGTWTLAVGAAPAPVAAPATGLRLGTAMTGTVTGGKTGVQYDVRARATGAWHPAAGVTLPGAAVRLGNVPARDGLLAPPGAGAATPWLDVTGDVHVATDATDVQARGTVAVNLTTGATALSATQAAPATLADPAGPAALSGARFGGPLDRISGTGLVTVPRPGGHPRPAIAALRVTDSGKLAATVPASAKLGASSNGVAPAAVASTANTSYTLSPAAYSFLTQQLHIPVGSSPTITGTLSGQTLTMTVGPPGPLPLNLPAGVPAPVFGSTTVRVDEASNTITITAGAAGAVTAALTVAIAHADSTVLSGGTDLTSTLTLGNVPFVGGTTISLTGNLGYSGGTLAASLAGALLTDLPLAGGSVTVQAGTTVTLATGTGLTIDGSALFGPASNPLTLKLTGSLTDLRNWSLSVKGTPGSPWQPLPGMTVYPAFDATITAAAGVVVFDLKSATDPTVTWSPGAGAMLTANRIEVSNQAPSSALSCPAIPDGHLWLDLSGAFTYQPSTLDALTADGCADLSGGSFKIQTQATGTLAGTQAFSLTKVALTATANPSTGEFQVTGSATATVNDRNGSVGGLAAAVSFGSDGVLAGVEISDLSTLDSSLSGSAVAYLSTADIAPFNPAKYGLTGGPFPATLPLRAGVNFAYSYSAANLPTNVLSALNKVHITPASATILAVLQVSTSGLDVNLDLNFGARDGGMQVFNTHNSALYLDDITFGVSAGQHSSVSVGGSAYLLLPRMWDGGSATATQVSVQAKFEFNSTAPTLSVILSDSGNAFGVTNLRIKTLALSVGWSLDTLTPTVGLQATQVMLPDSWSSAVGLASGAQVSIDAQFDLTQPVVRMSILPATDGPAALTPLKVVSDSPQLVNSLVVQRAMFYVAPFGGTTVDGLPIAKGLGVSFHAVVDSVPAVVEGAVGVAPASLTVDVSVGNFTLGPVTMGNTHLLMNLSKDHPQIGFSGSFNYAGSSFTGSVDLVAGNTAIGASVSFTLVAGLPSFLRIAGTLTGVVGGDGSGAYFNASGWGSLTAGGVYFGTVHFTMSSTIGLGWSDTADSIGRLVQWFQAYGNQNTMIAALQSLGYTQFDVVNALGAAQSYGASVLSALESTFNPFSTTYYDIWTQTSAGQLLVMDVSNGSQAPNAPVLTWTWNNGYNQDWAFVPVPQSPGWYEVVNRGSGQCLSDYNNSLDAGSPLVQYPCFGGTDQLWYFGNIALNYRYVVTSWRSNMVMDVQNAYPWAGGTMDQYPYNGGGNQQFWLTNSGN